jgi:hypothetical protein
MAEGMFGNNHLSAFLCASVSLWLVLYLVRE